MRTTLSLLLVAFIAMNAPVAAAPGNPASAVDAKAAKVTIEGTSTMHDYSLVTTSLVITSSEIEATSLLRPGALRKFEVQIPVNAFASDKDGLKKKFLETIKAKEHPFITFTLGDYTLDGTVIRATGTLNVAGVAKPIDLALDVKETAAGLHIVGTHALLMTEFGIKPPTMFMGMLKTHDKVVVTIELQLALAAQASN